MRSIFISLFASLSLLSVQPALAQQFGRIVGQVIDRASGEPLPGANVIVEGTVLGAASGLDGKYEIRRVPPGAYTVRASMIGFKSARRKNVVVRAGETTRVDFHLTETVIEIPDVVVTASRRPQSFAETPNTVAVVSARQIQRKNDFTLNEVLQYAPGVNFMGSQVNIRGSSGYSRGAGSRVLLLIDGVPMLPGDSGDIKWDIIPLPLIDKVEIVKGAGSALYGSSAIGGVINILTKEPGDRPETLVRVNGGLYDKPVYKEWRWTDRTLNFNEETVTHINRFGRLRTLLSLARRETTGFKQNGHSQQWNLYGKLRYDLSARTNVSVFSTWGEDDHGNTIQWRSQNSPLTVPPEDLGSETLSRKFVLSAGIRQIASRYLSYQFRVTHYRNSFRTNFSPQDSSLARKYRADLKIDWLPFSGHSFTFGAEVNVDDVTSSIFADHRAWDWGIYTEDEVALTDELHVTAGVRYDRHEVDTGLLEWQVSPKFGLTFKISPDVNFRASSGRGFRAAAMAEMFTRTRVSGFEVIPNIKLFAERSWSHEIGANALIARRFFVDGALFWSDYWDLIEAFPKYRGGRVLLQFQNLTRARIRGGEIFLRTSWLQNKVEWSLGYTYLNPKDLTTGEVLAYRPRHLLTSSLNARWKSFEAGFDYRYVSRLEAVRIYPKDDRVPQKVLDLWLAVIRDPYTLRLNVDNALNYNYTQIERNLEPIRSFSATVEVRL
jgi:iron complex outermembrane receptor protein